MKDNEIMPLKKAMFILRHGSAEGEHKYFEAIDVVEKEINRQKAEIERLKKEQHQFDDLGKMYSEIKTEAIKEFAERLKNATLPIQIGGKHNYDVISKQGIDHILKEVVGEGG